MASPHVAGVAALLVSIFPNKSAEEIREALELGAQGTSQCGSNEKYGYGHVDALASADYLDTGNLPQVTCTTAQVRIKKDNYGSETSWYIENADGIPIAGGGPYDDQSRSTEVESVSLPDLPPNECYTFVIEDSVGDG